MAAALGDGVPFQWVENEYMLQSEYDELLTNPNRFVVQKLWPRISTTMGLLSGLAQTAEAMPLLSISSAYVLPGFVGGSFSRPENRDLIERLLELSIETEKNSQIVRQYSQEMTQLGYPFVVGPMLFCRV